jgi:hypothetical protein
MAVDGTREASTIAAMNPSIISFLHAIGLVKWDDWIRALKSRVYRLEAK